MKNKQTSTIQHRTLNIELEISRRRRTFRRSLFNVGCSMFLLLLLGCATERNSPTHVQPLRALLITGGCCHDYEGQKKILTEGISARANVTWTIVHEGGDAKDHAFTIYTKPDWTKGYDVIVHNECAGKVTDVKFVQGLARAHSNGVPAVMIHCSIHSYREAETDEWRKLLGVSSFQHQQHVAFEVKNLKPAHPVMKGFPASWTTPKGELYEIEKVWPNCIPLAEAYGVRTEKNHHCIWINTYGKARVFGTTIGHFNEEMDNDIYLSLVTRGLLWSCDKLNKDGKPKKGFGKKL